jgi:hypothetical protein
MIQRVFMNIKRGMTDNTTVCVFPWEKPILEEIHGGNAEQVSIDEMCSLRGAVKVKELKLKHETSEKGLDLRAQLEAMARVLPDQNPLDDPEAEFNRLVQRYGMHMDVNLPNVTKVFGSFGNFRVALRDYARGRVPAMFEEASSPIDVEEEEKPLAEMTDAEVRAKLKARNVKVPKGASREALDDLFLQAETA